MQKIILMITMPLMCGWFIGGLFNLFVGHTRYGTAAFIVGILLGVVAVAAKGRIGGIILFGSFIGFLSAYGGNLFFHSEAASAIGAIIGIIAGVIFGAKTDMTGFFEAK